MKVLFLGCHCDDIELGCGATIYKHRSDWDVYTHTFCSQGYTPSQELVVIEDVSRQSQTNLGVENVSFGKVPPDHFHLHRQQIWECLTDLRRSIQPDVVVTQLADDHQDHVVLYNESVRVFREKTLLSYPCTMRSTRSFDPDTFEVVGGEDVAAKLRSMHIYQQFYTNKHYFQDSNVIAMLRANGLYTQNEFAEVYNTITRINI